MSLIPLYYVGWADSVLSPSEVQLIQRKIESLPFLNAKDKILLQQWSNPSKPPSKQLFRHWKQLIRTTAAEAAQEKRKNLVDLALEMAKSGSVQADSVYWSSPQTRDALSQLEISLGVDGSKSLDKLLQKKQRPDDAPFDINALRELLDGPYAEKKQQIRLLLQDPAFQLEEMPTKEEKRAQVLQWCKLLAKQGLGALSYPKEQGGKDDMMAYIAIFEMLGMHDLSMAIKFGVQFGLFGGSVLWLGTQYHHNKYLKATGSLKLPGCFAMTETGHGSNVRGLETTATYDPQTDEIIIHSPTEEAGKEYIGNALDSKMATVFAQLIVDGTQHGVHAILVPLRNDSHELLDGVRVEDCGYKMGLNGVDNGRIWFDQVRVPRVNLLNRFGNISPDGVYSSPIANPSSRFFTMLGTLVGGRVCVPKAGLSAAKVGLTIAIRYGLRRRQFAPKNGEPETILLDYPSHQRRLMPLLAKTYALHFGLDYLADRYVARTEDDIREIESLAAGLKSYTTWFSTHCLQSCREACGGKGYLAENRIADLKADTDIFTTFEGDNTVLMQLVAKGLLSAFRQEFHDEGFRAVMRYLVSQFSASVSEMNPVSRRKTDTAHLLDPEFQLAAFQHRERQLLVSVSQRMRAYLRKGFDSHSAFLRCQTHILTLAEAYVDRIVLEQFIHRVNDCPDDELQESLKRLCDLYALHTIESHKGWYLESEYMGSPKTKAIRRLVDRLCRKVRAEAAELTEAFGIPDSCIAAPIAL